MAGSKTVNSCQITYGDHEDQWVDARGTNVVEYFNDFVHVPVASDAMAGWTTTLVEAGSGDSTVTAADASGGALLLTTDDADNDGINLQMSNESFLPSSSNSLYFGISFQASEVTQSDFFLGLSVTNTDILGNLPKRIGFRKVDGSTGISFDSEGTVETTVENAATFKTVAARTGATPALDANTLLEFVWDATNSEARYYEDGTLKGSVALGTSLPDAEMAVSFHFLTGDASAETMQIDWVRVIQAGR
jgi:hypothetical protein